MICMIKLPRLDSKQLAVKGVFMKRTHQAIIFHFLNAHAQESFCCLTEAPADPASSPRREPYSRSAIFGSCERTMPSLQQHRHAMPESKKQKAQMHYDHVRNQTQHAQVHCGGFMRC